MRHSAGVDGFVVGLPVTRQGNIRRRETDSVQVIRSAMQHNIIHTALMPGFSSMCNLFTGPYNNSLVQLGDQKHHHWLLCVLNTFQNMRIDRLHTNKN